MEGLTVTIDMTNKFPGSIVFLVGDGEHTVRVELDVELLKLNLSTAFLAAELAQAADMLKAQREAVPA